MIPQPFSMGYPEEHSFFLFINSGSGGGVGTKLVTQEIQKIEFNLQMNEGEELRRCHTYFYNMRMNEARDLGFKKLRRIVMDEQYQKQKPTHKCFAIVCGGDGTVMWVISEMIKHEIQVTRVPIAIIPLGTGNDFSRELGWGGVKSTLLQNNYRSLKKLIKLWIHARQQYFDIWDIEAEVYENGKFEVVQENENKLLETKIIRKTFCNYFSFGIDGKIGYSFDMHRTSTRLGNLAMYGVLGFAKTFTRTKTIDELVQSIEIGQQKRDILKQQQNPSSNSLKKSQQQQKMSSIFQSKHKSLKTSKIKEQIGKKEEKYFNKGFYNLLMLNVNSFTGGVTDIWDKAKPGFFEENNVSEYTEVSTGDGKIEVVSFPSSMALAMERGLGGFAKQVTQSSGPIIFNFYKYQQELKHRTYLQIDGQFIRFTHPKRIMVQQSAIVPKGKIKVIRKNPDYDPYMPK